MDLPEKWNDCRNMSKLDVDSSLIVRFLKNFFSCLNSMVSSLGILYKRVDPHRTIW